MDRGWGMIYFAYGSNLDYLQMISRAPHALLVEPAWLDGYRLCFPRRSFVRATAVASIEPAAGEKVWGALYDVPEREMDRLDAREGYSAKPRYGENICNRISITAQVPERPPVEAMTYVVNPKPEPGLPSADYLSLIVSAAIVLRAPKEYIAMLRAMPRAA